MNNLTPTQQTAKQAYLDNQREQMPDKYKNSGAKVRGAIIRQIDSFLSVVSKDARIS